MGTFPLKMFLAAMLSVSTARAGFSNRGVVPSAVGTACPTDFALMGGGLEPRPTPMRPPILARSTSVPLANKVTEIKTLLLATNVVELSGVVDRRLRHLPNGNYIYAIDSKKRLVYLPRTLIPDHNVDIHSLDAEFLGSHEGIRQYLREIYGEEPDFLAAGEITVRDNRVMMVSNGSGSFRGGAENLNYAVDELQTHGLAVTDQTTKRDYSVKSYGNPHAGVAVQARMEIEASRSPSFLSLQRTVRAVMKKVEDRYPGKIAFVRDAMKVKDRELQGELLEAAGIFGLWQAPQEAEAYVIKTSLMSFGRKVAPQTSSPVVLEKAGEPHLRKLMRLVEEFIDNPNASASPR